MLVSNEHPRDFKNCFDVQINLTIEEGSSDLIQTYCGCQPIPMHIIKDLLSQQCKASTYTFYNVKLQKVDVDDLRTLAQVVYDEYGSNRIKKVLNLKVIVDKIDDFVFSNIHSSHKNCTIEKYKLRFLGEENVSHDLDLCPCDRETTIEKIIALLKTFIPFYTSCDLEIANETSPFPIPPQKKLYEIISRVSINRLHTFKIIKK